MTRQKKSIHAGDHSITGMVSGILFHFGPTLLRGLAIFAMSTVSILSSYAQIRLDSLYALLKYQSFGHVILPAENGFYVIGNGTDMSPHNSQASIFTSFALDGAINFSVSTHDPDMRRLYQDLNAVIIDSIAYTTFVGSAPEIMQFNIRNGHVIHRTDLDNSTGHPYLTFPFSIHQLDTQTLVINSASRNLQDQLVTQLSVYNIRDDSLRYYLNSYPGYHQNITDVIVLQEGFILGGFIYKGNTVGIDFEAHATVVWLDRDFLETNRYISDNAPYDFQWAGYNLIIDADGSIIGTNCPGYKYIFQDYYYFNMVRPSLFKLDAQGVFLWQRPMGRDLYFGGLTRFHCLIHSNLKDGYIAAGKQPNFSDSIYYETTSDTNELGEKLRFKGLIAKVSTSGDSLWSRLYYKSERTFTGIGFHGIIPHPEGGYILAGYSSNPPPPGADTTWYYTWILYVDEHGCAVPGCHETVRTADPALPDPIRLHPNPVVNDLYIYQHENESILYTIVNMEGRIMTSFTASQAGSTAIVDVSRYAPGGYVLIKKDTKGRLRTATWVKI